MDGIDCMDSIDDVNTAEYIKYDPHNSSTDHVVIFAVKAFGYDPAVNSPNDFPSLYADLSNCVAYCDWIRSLVPADILIDNTITTIEATDTVIIRTFNRAQRRAVHLWMGERSPVWAKWWQILLNVIVGGYWDTYVW